MDDIKGVKQVVKKESVSDTMHIVSERNNPNPKPRCDVTVRREQSDCADLR